jgi:hypothetical protein
MSDRKSFRAIPIQHGRQFRKRAQHRKRQTRFGRTGRWLTIAAILGAGVGFASTRANLSSDVAHLLPDSSTATSTDAWTYYANCEQARAVGTAPLYVGQPGYRSQLDADGDGIACEPYPR